MRRTPLTTMPCRQPKLEDQVEGGLTILHKAEDDTVNWLYSVVTTALAK